jgi:transposase
MKIHPGFVGCDISKAHLDLFDGAVGVAERIANQAEAIAQRLEPWRNTDVLILFEATGPYDRILTQALTRAGIAFVRVNPARARDFARATGVLAKTDRIDARMLAAMAQTLRPAIRQPRSPDRDRLADLHKRRDQLVAMRKQERTRQQGCADEIADDIRETIAWLDLRIAALERAIQACIQASAPLAEAERLLRSIPGIGPVASATLIALLPELGARSPKAIAALAGLAPYNVDSGQFRGSRRIHGGRRRVREALYMAAVCAARIEHRFSKAYKSMINAGKPPKVALIAIARKILVIANAMLRQRIAFNP